MKKTFITQVPDKSGAFLKASRIIAEAGGNITRVSYNKAIDLHMLFIEVSATEEQLTRSPKRSGPSATSPTTQRPARRF